MNSRITTKRPLITLQTAGVFVHVYAISEALNNNGVHERTTDRETRKKMSHVCLKPSG